MNICGSPSSAFRTVKRIVAPIVMLLAMVARAGPFGYEMGQKIEGEPYPVPGIEGTLGQTRDAPAPFDSLTLYYTPTIGLCIVSASLNNVGDEEIKGHFDELRSDLTRVYGEPTTSSESFNGWRSKSSYDDNVSNVTLHIIRGSLVLLYEFSNSGDCVEEAANIRAGGKDARPFGYKMGQKIEGEPHYTRSDGLFLRYTTHNLPAPFTGLGLVSTPNAGLCEILALAETDDYEVQFSKLKTLLTDKYGSPISSNESSMIWVNPSVRNPDAKNISVLGLWKNVELGHNRLTYTFTNKSDCEAEAKAMRQSDGLLDSL